MYTNELLPVLYFLIIIMIVFVSWERKHKMFLWKSIQTCLDDVDILAPYLVHQLNVGLIVCKLSQNNFARFNTNFSCNEFSQLCIKRSLKDLSFSFIHFTWMRWSTNNFHCRPTNWSVEPRHFEISEKTKSNVESCLQLTSFTQERNLGSTESTNSLLQLPHVCCAGQEHVLIVKTSVTSLGWVWES